VKAPSSIFLKNISFLQYIFSILFLLVVTCQDCVNHYKQNNGCDNQSLSEATSDQILDSTCTDCDESLFATACGGGSMGMLFVGHMYISQV
jgi:hypothetical protein